MDIYEKLSLSNSNSWTPPVPNSQLDEISEKLPLSTRVYPEYIVALYAFFQSEHGKEAKSLSQLLLWAVQEAVNANWGTIQRLPNPQMSVDFLRDRGFLSATKDNKLAIGRISQKEEEMQHKLEKAGDNPFALYDFWKDRDPEKASHYLELAEQQFREAELEQAKQDANPSPAKKDEEETIINHTQGITKDEEQDRSTILTPDMLEGKN